MKLGIMQPYFFPYLGYYSLIKHTDKWVVFDNVQYIRRGWINRNRIIHPTKPESIYITVPVKDSGQETSIRDALIDDALDWRSHMLSQIESAYKKRAPYYSPVRSLLQSVLSLETPYISELAVYSLQAVCAYLHIPFDCSVFSRMNLKIGPVDEPGDWALRISAALDADTYINPPGGQALFEHRKFEEENIKLQFLQIHFEPYNQKKSVFLEGLSILDVLMFNSVEKVNTMLDDCEVFG